MGGWGVALILIGGLIAVVAAKGTYKYLPPFNSLPYLQPTNTTANKSSIVQDSLASIQAQIAAAYKSTQTVIQ